MNTLNCGGIGFRYILNVIVSYMVCKGPESWPRGELAAAAAAASASDPRWAEQA